MKSYVLWNALHWQASCWTQQSVLPLGVHLDSSPLLDLQEAALALGTSTQYVLMVAALPHLRQQRHISPAGSIAAPQQAVMTYKMQER